MLMKPAPPEHLLREANRRAMSNRPPKEWQLVWTSSGGNLTSDLMTHLAASDLRMKLIKESKVDIVNLCVELNVDQAEFESELDRARARRAMSPSSMASS